MTRREETHTLVDRLSEAELETVHRMLRGLVEPGSPLDETPEARRARVYALAGSAAHLPGRVDEFLARKREDKAREDERDRRRQEGMR